MRNFDVKKYIEEGKTTYSKRKDIEALADKDPSAAKMIHRYHSGGEDWTAKKDCICVASE